MNPERLLTELDGPRPLPPELARRIERELTGSPRDVEIDASDASDLLMMLDVPRSMSPRARSSIESALVRSVPVPMRRAPIAAIASVAAVAVVAGLLIAVRAPDPQTNARAPRAAGLPAPGAAAGDPPPEAGSRPAATAGPLGSGRRSAPVQLQAPAAARSNPPPFAYRGRAPDGPSVRAGGPSLRVGIAGGDAAQEAGFRGYLEALNTAGGIHGRRIETVGPSAADALVIVNLSGTALAAPPGDGSLLETITATEDVLRGRTFSFASPPERQAHLLVNAVFPQREPSAVAVVYRGVSGVFADEIPDALGEMLGRRDVQVVEITYERGQPVPLVPADAVFLSLDQATTLAFLDYARSQSYRAMGTVACIFPMLDTRIVDRLRDGYLVLSPYSLGYADEAHALTQASGRALSSASIHGWVTAKALAAALWRTGADTPGAATAAIRGLAGFDLGFAPAVELRRGSNARVPDGILYEVRRGSFVPRTGFETDTY